MSHYVEIIDQVEPPLRRSKNIYQTFDVAAVSTNVRYQFQPDQQVEENVITGIDVGFFSGVAWNFPAQISVNGKTYNTIQQVDLAKVMVTLYDKKNNFLLRRVPLDCFRRDLIAEIKIYELEIYMDSSFLEFVQTPFFTPLPLIIPFQFYWNDKH